MTVEIDKVSVSRKIVSVKKHTERHQVDCSRVEVQQKRMSGRQW